MLSCGGIAPRRSGEGHPRAWPTTSCPVTEVYVMLSVLGPRLGTPGASESPREGR